MKKLISTVAVALLSTAGLGGLGATAHAGEQFNDDFVIVYNASGSQTTAIIDSITPELFEADGVTPVTGCSTDVTNGGQSVRYLCSGLNFNEYVVGVSGVPDTATVTGVSCGGAIEIGLSLEGDFSSARRQHGPFGSICTVSINSLPRVAIDTVVIGGPATVADFSYDILDDTNTAVATGVTDPAPTQCTRDALSASCSSTSVTAGTHTLRANAVADSYILSSVLCDDALGSPASTSFPPFEPGGEVADALCTVTYSYATQELAVDVVVVNDDGGTATASDFTIEVRDATNTVVATGTDPEPGTGNASAIFTLPLGEYTITVTGPNGYEITVETTVVDRPADAAVADFSLTATQTVTGVVTANDPTPTTTTTTLPPATTTTLAPTTTLPPATTTTIFVAVLPETGPSDTTAPIALIAVLLTLFGAGAVLATRRS